MTTVPSRTTPLHAGVGGLAALVAVLAVGVAPLVPFAARVPVLALAVLAMLLVRSLRRAQRAARRAHSTALEVQDDAVAMLRQGNADLARRIDELSAFAGTVSHDLKGPLTSLVGFVDIARRPETPPEVVELVLERAASVGQRMHQLIDGLLAHARAERQDGPGAAGPVDTRIALALALESLDHELGATGGTVDVGPLPEVWADPDRVVQVLQNLVANGLRHGAAPGEAPRLHVGGEVVDGVARLWVDDAGCGIPLDDRERVLAPFGRGSRTLVPGSGLGLATVDRLVAAMGGTLRIDDSPRGGARLLLELPRPAGVAAAPVAAGVAAG